MPNPVVIGGYVNVALAGPTGRSFTGGDLDDVYEMDLVAGQVIELVIPSADPSLPDGVRDDADLYLFDSNGNLVDLSVDIGQVEQLTVGASGSGYPVEDAPEPVTASGLVDGLDFVVTYRTGIQATASSGKAVGASSRRGYRRLRE